MGINDKEVIGEILGKEVADFKIVGNSLNYIIENYETEEDEERVYIDLGCNINIHEFIDLGLEWAFNNFDFNIIIFKINDDLYKCEISDIRDSLGSWVVKHSLKANNKFEALIEASKWLLETYNCLEVIKTKGNK